jgi:hypothetical protein
VTSGMVMHHIVINALRKYQDEAEAAQQRKKEAIDLKAKGNMPKQPNAWVSFRVVAIHINNTCTSAYETGKCFGTPFRIPHYSGWKAETVPISVGQGWR